MDTSHNITTSEYDSTLSWYDFSQLCQRIKTIGQADNIPMFDNLKYAQGPEGDLIEINSISAEDRYAFGPYSCICCSHTMVSAIGKVRAHHFKHKAGRPCLCNDETYLHNLAKLIVYNAISTAMENNKPYFITSIRPIICDYFKDEYGIKCTGRNSKFLWDVCENFDTVKLEKGVSGFVADTLLSSSKSDEKMLLEIEVTHPCEPEKIESRLKILEIKVSSEEEIEVLKTGIDVTGHNVRTYNYIQPAPIAQRL